MSRRNRAAAVVIVLCCLLLATVPAAGGPPSDGRAPIEPPLPPPTVSFSLDGVALELTTSFLSDPKFATFDPHSAIQVAAAVDVEPLFTSVSITAVPFGVAPPTESLPAAGPGREEAYRAALRDYREEQHGEPREGAVMNLFDENVPGATSVVTLHVRDGDPVPVAITEWVVEAGPRLWIVRASRELESGTLSPAASAYLISAFSDSVLRSRDLTRPSTSLAAVEQAEPGSGEAPVVVDRASDLPAPAWWDGECNTINFQADTGVAAYPLGAEYRGMKACGPHPWPHGPWRWVSFGPGLIAQIEWQCPELSKRFLYLAYGIPPYYANGNQMVSNYDGDLLEKVWNCTPGRVPQADDVLAYGASSTYGHTSVVVASDVDAKGNGTVEVIEQNSSPNGYDTLDVTDWCVAGGYVIGWLHRPGWSVEYFDDASLIDRCATSTRTDVYLFETWEDGAPADGCPADRFSARFSRAIDLPGGVYTFALGYDDGARLKVDGETVVDGWGSSTQHYEVRQLEGGHHQVSVAYYDNTGEAALSAFWWGPGFELTREARDDPSRWYAEHWGNRTLWWDPVVTVREGDGPLDHRWLWDAPADNLPVDFFSSRFRRTVSLDAGRWQFELFADDGVRFWIDDQRIVDRWLPQRAWFTPTVTVAGGNYPLVVEHYENEEVADIWLDWERVSEMITPTAWVSSPLTGTIIEACPITVEAQVSDGLGLVDRVEFHAYYDGRWHHLGDDDASPYSHGWDCRYVANQPVGLQVHVWDETGGEYIDLDGRVVVSLDHLDDGRVHLPLVLRLTSDGP